MIQKNETFCLVASSKHSSKRHVSKVCMILQICLFNLSLRKMAPVTLCDDLYFNLSLSHWQKQKITTLSSWVNKIVHVLTEKTEFIFMWTLTYLYWPPDLREQHGNSLFKISCSSFFPPSLLASPIKVLMLFTLSFLWPPSSALVLRLSSPSVSNSSSFIETNRLEVTPGRADDDSWLLRSTQSEGFSFASKTWWYSFVAMAPNFLLA